MNRERPLLDSALMGRIEKLDLLSRKILSGKLGIDSVARRSSRAAALLPIDYRDYSPGDEERFIDWNVYARLDRMVVKIFAEEQDFFVHLLFDVSSSCDYGEPDKGRYMRQAAAALGYVGLSNSRHVSLAAFADGLVADSGMLRGRGRTGEMIRFLERMSSRRGNSPSPSTLGEGRGEGLPSAPTMKGPHPSPLPEYQERGQVGERGQDGGKPVRRRTDFRAACGQFARSRRRRGLCIVLSDFLFRDGLNKGLDLLRAAGHEIFCVQVLSPQELSPDLGGGDEAVELVDAEGGGEISVGNRRGFLERYSANLAAHRESVRHAVERRGGRLMPVSTALPIERLVLEELKSQGVLR